MLKSEPTRLRARSSAITHRGQSLTLQVSRNMGWMVPALSWRRDSVGVNPNAVREQRDEDDQENHC